MYVMHMGGYSAICSVCRFVCKTTPPLCYHAAMRCNTPEESHKSYGTCAAALFLQILCGRELRCDMGVAQDTVLQRIYVDIPALVYVCWTFVSIDVLTSLINPGSTKHIIVFIKAESVRLAGDSNCVLISQPLPY